MRDYRDAKAMAHSLREALAAKAVTFNHSECLELIAKSLGAETWNILSAKIEAAKPSVSAAVSVSAPAGSEAKAALKCSFCCKSQHDIQKLIAGPKVFICNECVALCAEIIDDEDLAKLLGENRAHALDRLRQRSVEELTAFIAQRQKEIDAGQASLAEISTRLSFADPKEAPAGDKRFGYLDGKGRDELLMFKTAAEERLRANESTLAAAKVVLAEREGA
ncbi:MAG TPA: ClpX C4-type zinc finger protein [Vitreimonas sp.]|jgi:uncharacterized coiled-coil protein SlyX|nr:ClpX C4-type zinc finger protein [Vitreimonas sp.]